MEKVTKRTEYNQEGVRMRQERTQGKQAKQQGPPAQRH
jgi:hypothetical protein